jgi:hypothetical protein
MQLYVMLITSQETASQSAHLQLMVRIPPLLPDVRTSALQGHLPRMASAFACLIADLVITVIQSPGNVKLILKGVLKATTRIL